MTLLTNLVLYWKLDETSGSSAADASGNGNNGTLVGNAAFNSGGKLNYGVSMDGNGDRVDGPSRTPPAAYSMSIWAKQAATGGFKILGHQQDANLFTYCFVNSGNGVVNYVYETNNSTRIGRQTANNAFPTDLAWHHVVVTWSGGTGATSIKIYVDGTQADTTSLTTGTFANRQTNACTACIGGGSGVASVNAWNGIQDEAGFWDRELTAAEVTKLYNGGVGLTYPFSPQNIIFAHLSRLMQR